MVGTAAEAISSCCSLIMQRCVDRLYFMAGQVFRPANRELRNTALAAEGSSMGRPLRGQTSDSTYFITTDTFQKQRLLQSERSALLLIDVLMYYCEQQKFLLHEFVVMPHHFHLLITPTGITVERSVGLIKGGFSFRRTKELG